MLLLIGTILNVLEVPKGTKKDGTAYGGYHQVQLMCEETLNNGEKRMDLMTMSTDHPEPFAEKKGSSVMVAVGVFARGGTLNFYMQKDALPIIAKGETKAAPPPRSAGEAA